MSVAAPKPGDALAFLDVVRGGCAETGVKCRLLTRALTQSGDMGEFDDKKKLLTVCVADPDWLTTVAHEYSHLKQWSEKAKVWEKINEAYDDVFTPWLKGKRVSPHVLRAAIRVIQRCELDCERRTIRLIKKFRLADPVAYTRTANGYVWSYEVARLMDNRDFHLPAHPEMLPSRMMQVRTVTKLPENWRDIWHLE